MSKALESMAKGWKWQIAVGAMGLWAALLVTGVEADAAPLSQERGVSQTTFCRAIGPVRPEMPIFFRVSQERDRTRSINAIYNLSQDGVVTSRARPFPNACQVDDAGSHCSLNGSHFVLGAVFGRADTVELNGSRYVCIAQ